MLERVAEKKTDRLFLLYVAILILFGLAALASASAPYGYSRFGDIYYFVKRQIFYGLLPGLLIFFIFIRFKARFWQRVSWVAYFACLAALIIVFIPGVGADFNKYAKSWIDIGFFHFQPAEFVKLGLIMVLAQMLSDPRRDLRDFKHGLLPVLGVIAPVMFLVLFQPDIGTLAVLGGISYSMLFLAKTPKIYLAIIGLLGVAGFALIALVAPYRMDRLTIFLHPELDPQGVGYHVNQAYLAVGSGGFWGLGLGHSRQKHAYLPEVQADSIYAVIAEELGFLFSAGLMVFILLIAWRGFNIAKEASDEYGYLLVCGIMVWFFWQSFINIGAMVGLLPLTGVTLPFVSHGGSSLMISLAAVGIVASVSRGSR
ncbi:MAG: putative lipid II flippase FtsW [Candidatus Magasanikbacteria bacterium]|nr:putative lipid II flippase FtsW [Candidatus Magasanikbacteria bacterium]